MNFTYSELITLLGKSQEQMEGELSNFVKEGGGIDFYIVFDFSSDFL